MPLHTQFASVPRRPRHARAIAIAAACAVAGTAGVAGADDQQVRSVAEAGPHVAVRYSDIEANKASSTRALGRYLAAQPGNRTWRNNDLELNKARGQRAR